MLRTTTQVNPLNTKRSRRESVTTQPSWNSDLQKYILLCDRASVNRSTLINNYYKWTLDTQYHLRTEVILLLLQVRCPDKYPFNHHWPVGRRRGYFNSGFALRGITSIKQNVSNLEILFYHYQWYIYSDIDILLTRSGFP